MKRVYFVIQYYKACNFKDVYKKRNAGEYGITLNHSMKLQAVLYNYSTCYEHDLWKSIGKVLILYEKSEYGQYRVSYLSCLVEQEMFLWDTVHPFRCRPKVYVSYFYNADTDSSKSFPQYVWRNTG
jgi:hypothetical protein